VVVRNATIATPRKVIGRRHFLELHNPFLAIKSSNGGARSARGTRVPPPLRDCPVAAPEITISPSSDSNTIYSESLNPFGARCGVELAYSCQIRASSSSEPYFILQQSGPVGDFVCI
jgi:hypothetical protein